MTLHRSENGVVDFVENAVGGFAPPGYRPQGPIQASQPRLNFACQRFFFCPCPLTPSLANDLSPHSLPHLVLLPQVLMFNAVARGKNIDLTLELNNHEVPIEPLSSPYLAPI